MYHDWQVGNFPRTTERRLYEALVNYYQNLFSVVNQYVCTTLLIIALLGYFNTKILLNLSFHSLRNHFWLEGGGPLDGMKGLENISYLMKCVVSG